MAHIKNVRLFASTFSLVVALLAGSFAYVSSAAGPLAYTYGPTSAPCDRTKATAPAGEQGTAFGIELRNFDRAEEITITFTFPDGRIVTPYQASALGGLITPPPPGGAFTDLTSTGGDYFNSFTPMPAWPYGCYTITAAGSYTTNVATAYYVILPGNSATNPGLTTLAIEDRLTNQPNGPQGTTVNIFGRGYPGEVPLPPIYVKQPDGTILPVLLLPGELTTDIGTFVATYTFTDHYQVGRYRFFVLGYNDTTVDATFDLTSTGIHTLGYGSARVAMPFPSNVVQGSSFELQGKLFGRNEVVSLRLIAPNGAQVPFDDVLTSALGTFSTHIPIDLSLPTGAYSVIVVGAASVATTTITVVHP